MGAPLAAVGRSPKTAAEAVVGGPPAVVGRSPETAARSTAATWTGRPILAWAISVVITRMQEATAPEAPEAREEAVAGKTFLIGRVVAQSGDSPIGFTT